MQATLTEALLSFHTEINAIRASDSLQAIAFQLGEEYPDNPATAIVCQYIVNQAKMCESIAELVIAIYGLPKGEPPADEPPLYDTPGNTLVDIFSCPETIEESQADLAAQIAEQAVQQASGGGGVYVHSDHPWPAEEELRHYMLCPKCNDGGRGPLCPTCGTVMLPY